MTKNLGEKFELGNKKGTRIRTVFCKNKRFLYYADQKCHEPRSYEEIFNFLMPYFNYYVKLYRNYEIQKNPITNSIFRLYIKCETESCKDLLYGKILYEIEIDNEHEDKIKKHEYKNLKLINNKEDKIIYFTAFIEVELFDENSFFQYDGEKEPRIEDICIICKKNKPNVLITKCFHLVACDVCYKLRNHFNCPYCKKSFTGIHKVYFATNTR